MSETEVNFHKRNKSEKGKAKHSLTISLIEREEVEESIRRPKTNWR